MTLHYADDWLTVYQGDTRAVMAEMPAESVHCVVTSPPYWGLRDYGEPGQLGLESTPEAYVEAMVAVFREVRRVLRADGTVWLNLGDSYAGGGTSPQGLTGQMVDRSVAASRAQRRRNGLTGGTRTVDVSLGGVSAPGLKPKDLVGIPWRVAFALQADGWYLRSEITWCKPNAMPESVTDRPTSATEKLFLFSKNARYYYDSEAVRETAADSSLARIAQPTFDQQTGGEKDYGNGSNRSARKTLENFAANPGRNLRNWWVIPSQPYGMVPIARSEAVGADAVGGDIRRTTSRDCPLHGDRPVPEPNARDGERAAASVSPLRSPGTSIGHALGQPAALAPIDLPHGEGSAVGSSGSPLLPRSPAATGRNSESHRTDPAPATTLPYTPSAETTDHTGDTSVGLGLAGSADHTPGSSSEPVGSVDHPSAQTPDRTVRTSSCTCSYRRVTTERVSHFATFPRKLVEPCIKAGTSERGVCPECGAPWERVVERTAMVLRRSERTHALGRTRSSGTMLEPPTAQTTGWQPTCVHVAQPVPAVVLDCFAGSGTTGLVAQSLGRRAVLIDLNADYLTQAMERNRDIPLGLGA